MSTTWNNSSPRTSTFHTFTNKKNLPLVFQDLLLFRYHCKAQPKLSVFTVPKLLYQASLVTQKTESTDFSRYTCIHTFRFTAFRNQPSRILKPSAWFQSLGSTTLLWLSQNETNLIPCSTDSNFVSGWVTIIWKRSCMSRFQWSVVKFKDIIWKIKISTEKLKAVLFNLWVAFCTAHCCSR